MWVWRRVALPAQDVLVVSIGSSGISIASCFIVCWTFQVGSGGKGRGVSFFFCGRSNGGAGCLGDCDMASQCRISLSGIQIGDSAPWGKIQAHPGPLVSNGSGPLHCPERRVFHSTRGFVLCCSGLQYRSIAVTPNESVFRLYITKRACCRIW